MMQHTEHTLHTSALPPIAQWAHQSLCDLIDSKSMPADTLLFVGDDDHDNWRITRAHMRALRAYCVEWMTQHALNTGDMVLMHPGDALNDAAMSATTCALMACGLHVLLPHGEAARQTPWRGLHIDAVFVDETHPQTPQGISTHTRTVDLRAWLHQGLKHASTSQQSDDAFRSTRQDEDVLSLWTSGSTGQPKRLTYTERALLATQVAWQQAKLLDDGPLGGPSLSLMFAHSIGVREALRTLWCDQRALSVLPSWLQERPYRVVRALCDHPPAHVTSGAALVDVFTALIAQFPMLRTRMLPTLRCVVLSGTSHTPETALPVQWTNALGMSETMQLTSTLVDDSPLNTLGAPLPGVTLKLVPQDDDQHARLWVKSDMMASNLPTNEDGWFDTRDLVSYSPTDGLRYAGRAGTDFVQTGLGQKLHRDTLLAHYKDLHPDITHLEILSRPDAVGVVGVAFVKRPVKACIQEIAARAVAVNQSMDLTNAQTSPALSALGVLHQEPPRTPLGKFAPQALQSTHAALLHALGDPLQSHPQKIDLAPTFGHESDLRRYSAPRLARLLEGIMLNWSYIRGHKDTLVALRHGKEVEVLDLVGGYGCTLLGHGDEALLAVARDALATGIPMSTQLSARDAAGALCKALAHEMAAHTGQPYIVNLSSTGAGAVDMALKHALLEHRARLDAMHTHWRTHLGHINPTLVQQSIEYNEAQWAAHPPVLFALERAYHGKTLGTLGALWDPAQRAPFGALTSLHTIFLPTQDSPQAREHLAHHTLAHRVTLRTLELDGHAGLKTGDASWSRVMGVLVEPVLGEGGVSVVDPSWLEHLGALDAPLMCDEIQCGLGRTGRTIASPVTPDYLILGKSLGGGVAKIAALLVQRQRYQPKFDEFRGATYDEDDYSSRVALCVLERLKEEDASTKAQHMGEHMGQALSKLAKTYPRVVKHVDGVGLMWGVTLAYPDDPASTVTATLARVGLGYISSAYLLNVHHIRTMPTTSAPNTLRLQPSIHFDVSQLKQLMRGLNALCRAWDEGNLFELVAHTVQDDPDTMAQQRQMAAHYSSMMSQQAGFTIVREAPAQGAARVAFVHNPVHTPKLLLADAPPFALLTSEQRLELIDNFTQLLEFCPMPSFSKNLYGGKVWMMGITMAVTPATLHVLKQTGDLGLVRAQMQHALELARAQGCTTVVFGAQTSIVTDGATTLHPPEGIQVSSGNTLTTAVAFDQMVQQCEALGIDLCDPRTKVAVVGATGSIGRPLSALLSGAPQWRAQVMLVGRAGSMKRLQKVRVQCQTWSQTTSEITCHDTLDQLSECDVIVAAVNSPHALIFEEHIHPTKHVLIADLSEPHAIDAQVEPLCSNAHVMRTGMLILPEDGDFTMSAHTPQGSAFACATEGILMGLSPHPDLNLVGEISPDNVKRMRALAKEHNLM